MTGTAIQLAMPLPVPVNSPWVDCERAYICRKLGRARTRPDDKLSRVERHTENAALCQPVVSKPPVDEREKCERVWEAERQLIMQGRKGRRILRGGAKARWIAGIAGVTMREAQFYLNL